MKMETRPRAAKNPAAPQRFRLLRCRYVGPRCAVRRGSQLNGWPRLRRGSASGCAHRAYPLLASGGPALTPEPIATDSYCEHRLWRAAVQRRLASPRRPPQQKAKTRSESHGPRTPSSL